MPIYESNGKKYNIPDKKVDAFLKSRNDAKLVDSTPYYLSRANSTPRESNILKQSDTPIGTNVVTGFVPGFEQGAKALAEGGKIVAGTAANVVTGSSRDAKKALGILEKHANDTDNYNPREAYNQDIQDNYEADMEAYWKQMDEWYKKHPSILGRLKNMLPFVGDIPEEPKNPNLIQPSIGDFGNIIGDNVDMRPYKLVSEALEQGDFEKAKSYLREKAGKKTWGDEVEAEAIKELVTLKPTEGIGAWIGNLTPQMIPNALAIASSLHPATRPFARPLGAAGMGALSASSGGTAMAKARQYTKETGKNIPESDILKAGAIATAIEIGTEYIPFSRYMSRAGSMVKSRIGKEVAQNIINNPTARKEAESLFTKASKTIPSRFTKQGLKEFGKDITAEALSEFSAESLGAIVPMIYAGKEDYPTLSEIIENGIEGAKAGLFMGALLGGGSLAVNNYAQNQRRKQQGRITLLDTDNGVVELLGVNGNQYTILNDSGEVADIPSSSVKESRTVGWDEFKQFSTEARKKNISSNTFANLEASEKRIVKQNYEDANKKFDQAFEGTPFIQLKEDLQNATREQQEEFILDVTTSKELTEGQKSAAIDFIIRSNAYASYNQAKESIVDDAVQEVTDIVEENVNPQMDAVVSAVIGGYDNPMQVIGGNIVQNEDGSINRDLSDKSVTIIDAEGKRIPVSIKFVESISENMPTQEAVDQATQIVSEPIIAQQENEEVRPYEVGEVVTADAYGNGIPFTGEVTDVTEDGKYIIVGIQSGQQMIVEPRQIINQDNIQGVEDGSLIEYRNEKGEVVQGVIGSMYALRPQGMIALENGEAVAIEDVIGLAKDANIENPITGQNADNLQSNIQQNVGASPAEQSNVSYIERIPQDEKGNLLFDQVPVETTIGALSEVYNDVSELSGVVDATINNIQKQIDKAKTPKPIGDINKDIANKRASNQQLEELSNRLSYWEGVRNSIEQSRPIEQRITEQLIGKEKESLSLESEKIPTNEERRNSIQSVTESRNISERVPQGTNGSQDEISSRMEETTSNNRGRETPTSGARQAIRGKESKQQQLDALESYAKETGIWIDDTSILGEQFSQGGENEVLYTPNTNSVFKLNNFEYAGDDVTNFFNRIEAHNQLFPEVGYKLIGFAKNSKGKISAVLEQPFVVEADRLATPEDIADYMQNLGFNQLDEDTYTNNDYEVFDAFSNNVLLGVDGLLYPIDTQIRKNTQEQTIQEKITEAEAETDTNPTEAQKEAGNYKKGKVTIQGFDISIEQPQGSVRSGVDENGKQWSVTMNNTYGYILKTEGKDGDHIDVFLGDNPDSNKVFVIDQVNPTTGRFDEHKVMLGFNSLEEAKTAYLSNYEEGWQGLGNITEVPLDNFKKWIDSSHRKTKPFADYKSAGKTEDDAGTYKIQGVSDIKDLETYVTELLREQGAIEENNPEEYAEAYDALVNSDRYAEYIKGIISDNDIQYLYDHMPVKTRKQDLIDFRSKLGDAGIELEDVVDTRVKRTGRRPDQHKDSSKHKDNDHVGKAVTIKFLDGTYVKGVIEKVSNGNISVRSNSNNRLYTVRENAIVKDTGIRFRTTVSEEESLIERSKADGTYMKAPNGKPTNLNEKQWIQVRSKAFKEWFGDWERASRINKLRESKAVEITGEEITPSDDLKQYKKNALEYGMGLQGEYTNKDTGNIIQLQRGRRNGGVNEVLQHDYKDAEHLQSIAAIPQIIENSLYIDSRENLDTDKNPDVKEYQYYVCGLKIGNEDYTVRSTIAVDKNGNRYYDHKLAQIEKGKLLDQINDQAVYNVGFGTTPGTKPTTDSSLYKDKILFSLLQANSSKVVDENGEPLVVYHGTTSDKETKKWNNLLKSYDSLHEPFTVFRRTNDGERNSGHFFNSDMQNAYDYGYNTYDVYLNLRNPMVIDAKGFPYSEIEYNGEKRDTYEWSAYAEKNGHDGVIFQNIRDGVDYNAMQTPTTDYVAFNSSQIKSATDNTGTFSMEDNDIRFREVKEDEAISFGKKYNLDEKDVLSYADAMERGSSGGAAIAFKNIKRTVRLVNDELSLGQFVKLFSPIKAELYEQFGDVDALLEEHIQKSLDARNAMEVARKRAEEEAEAERKRLEEFELMSDDSLDSAYFAAVEANNENRMRDIVNEAARRKGYLSTDEFRMAHRAPSYDEEGIDKSMVDVANNKDLIRDSLNEQLQMNRDTNRDESAEAISNALNAINKGEKPTVTIYRAVPKSLKEGKVRNGDWVTLSESYAKQHGNHALDGDYRIMKEEVPAENLYWDGNDINEWGYDDKSDYRYKNVKNNRKLNDLITRDDKGDIIPPSKRFNSRKSDLHFREKSNIDSINSQFNKRLEELDRDRNQKDRVLHLGTASKFLIAGGLSDSDIVMEFDKFVRKSGELYKNKHPFEAKDIIDLPKALNDPIAIFNSKNGKDKVVLTELRSGDNNFIVAIKTKKQNRKGGVVLEINEIATLFPKDARGIIDWINSGLVTNLNKKKALHWIKALPTHPGTPITNEELSSVTKIVKSFVNPTLEEGKISSAVEELSESLNTPVHIIRDVNEIADDNRGIQRQKRGSKGWYDRKTGEVFFVLPNAENIADAQATVLHEVVGHKGLRGLLGDKFDDMLYTVFEGLPKDIKSELIKEALREYGGDPRIPVEEFLARCAEEDLVPSLWDKIKASLKAFFRSLGIDLKISDNDIRYMLWKSKNRIMKGDTLDEALKKTSNEMKLLNSVLFRDGGPTVAATLVKLGKIEKLNQDLNKKYNKSIEAWQNAIHPVEKWIEYLRKSGMRIEDYDDYAMQYSSIIKKIEARGEVFRENYLKPLLDSIAAIQKEGKVSYRDVISYMMLKHGPERNEKMRQDAINQYKLENQEATQKQIDRFAKRLSDDYAGAKAIEQEVGMSAEEYTSSFEERIGKELIDKLWANTRKATSFGIEEEYKAGLISKAQRDGILSMYEHYVPLKGHDADTMEDVYDYGHKPSVFFSPLHKKAEGRISRAEDPIAYIALDAQSAIHESMNNVHLQQIKRIATRVEQQAKERGEKPHVTVSNTWYKKVGEKDGKPIWSVADEAVYPTDGSLSNEQAQEEYRKNIEDYETYMEELAEKGEAYRSGSKRLNTGMFIKPAQARQHEVHVWQNGVMHTIRFNTNPAIPRAINKANLIHSDRHGASINKLIGALGSATRILSAMYTTFRPAFALVTNPLRDFGYTFNRLLVKEGWDYSKKAAKNYAISIAMIPAYLSGRVSLNNKHIGEYMMHYANFISNGGPTGLSDLVELKDVQRQIQREIKIAQRGKIKGMPTLVKKYAISAFKNLSEWPENVSRFAVYLTSIETGRGIPRAIYDAKNVTVDFNKKGSGAYGNSEARTLFAFINAGVQGLSNVIETAKANPLGVTISIAGYAIMPAIVMPIINSFLAGIAGDDDDEKWKKEYAKLSDFTRNNNICIYTGNGFVTIPLNQEYRMFNGVGANYFMFKEGKKNIEDIGLDLFKGVADLIAYNPVSSAMEGSIADTAPTTLVPWGQVQANSTFYGSPIYNQWARGSLPAYRQVRRNKKGESYAPESLVEFYGWLNQITGGDDTMPGWISKAKIGKHDFSNPDVVNHYLSGYIPAFYNPIIKQLDNLRSDESINKKIKNLFVPGAIYKSSNDLPNLDRYTMERYYDISKQIDESKTQYNDIMKNSRDLSVQQKKIDKHPDIVLKASFAKYLNKIKEHEKKLKELRPEEQDEYELLIDDMKVRFIEQYDDALKNAEKP